VNEQTWWREELREIDDAKAARHGRPRKTLTVECWQKIAAENEHEATKLRRKNEQLAYRLYRLEKGVVAVGDVKTTRLILGEIAMRKTRTTIDDVLRQLDHQICKAEGARDELAKDYPAICNADSDTPGGVAASA